MEESTNSFKDAFKERLSNPFFGKLLLAWIIWNWKITYVTFFVSEDNLDSVNRLDYISNYLKIENFFNVFNIYLLPLIITIFIIWFFPYISHEAYKASEKFRKKNALKKKETDDEINNFKDKQIQSLNTQISQMTEYRTGLDSTIEELKLLAEYLVEEIKLVNNKNNEKQKDIFLEQFRKDITNNRKRDRVFNLISGYNQAYDENKHYKPSDKSHINFLFENGLIENEKAIIKLSPFGEFISKNILFDKYRWTITDFDGYRDLKD